MSTVNLSIITVTLNNRNGLAKTIASVCEQTYKDFEFIIIDGGSIDGTLELVEKNKQIVTELVSETDGGIYNAMNKGIAQATGEYIQFLNAGDYYTSKESLNLFFKENLVADIIYADYKDASSGHLFRMPRELSFRFFYHQSLNHQSSFISRNLFERVGLYNEKSPIIADWEFFIQSIILEGASTQYIPQPLICFDFTNSISNNPLNLEKIRLRRAEVLRQYFPLLVRDMEYIDAVERSTTFQLLRRITMMKSFFSK